MPTYPYSCPDGHYFEVVKSMSDHRATEPCPRCGQSAPQKFMDHGGINGGALSEDTLSGLRPVLGRSAVDGIREARDVERALDSFHAKYPHLARPELHG